MYEGASVGVVRNEKRNENTSVPEECKKYSSVKYGPINSLNNRIGFSLVYKLVGCLSHYTMA